MWCYFTCQYYENKFLETLLQNQQNILYNIELEILESFANTKTSFGRAGMQKEEEWGSTCGIQSGLFIITLACI